MAGEEGGCRHGGGEESGKTEYFELHYEELNTEMMVRLNNLEVIAVDCRWWFGLLLLLNDKLKTEKSRIFIHGSLART